MSAVFLNWHSMPYQQEKFFVKGTIIAQAIIPGCLSRFAIREVRGGRGEDGYPTLRYCIADAATVSDEDVRSGKSPKAVFWADTIEDCLEFVKKAY